MDSVSETRQLTPLSVYVMLVSLDLIAQNLCAQDQLTTLVMEMVRTGVIKY